MVFTQGLVSGATVVAEETSLMLLLIPVLPLLGCILNYLSTNSKESRHRLSGWVASLFSLLSFGVVACSFMCLKSGEVLAKTAGLWSWFESGNLAVDFAFRFDHLSAVMCLIITGVGTLIHFYAIGYMAHDDNRPRFFCYLNLFLFFMLLLVLGDNLLVMFVGWEGVGLCSYLLIGFWHKEMDNAKAGQKAFVVNRIGDAGFLLGIFMLIAGLGAVDFPTLAKLVATMPPYLIEITALLLLIGAVGKSAQIPLYIWLPDAMAGPTPVSALIHAATMVTAGVYMITRMSFLFELAPTVLLIIMGIGTATAFVAATIALVQNDIKKVLAYSTVSQLGFMFMALGAGAFSNGIYHVVTHAFFKACLFMGAGSVIMGCHHEQDMRKFGGLLKKMPLTGITYLVATLAIAGIPPLSGFFSKDAILWSVYSSGSASGAGPALSFKGAQSFQQICWMIGVLTATITAFYMTRSFMMTFTGKYRGHHEAHESPLVVTIPLIILAVLSAGFAYLYGEHLMHFLHDWTRLDLQGGHEKFAHNHTYHLLETISIYVAFGGMITAIIFYGPLQSVPKIMSKMLSPIHSLLSNKYWVDEAYEVIVVSPLRRTANWFFTGIDRATVDAAVSGIGMLTIVKAEFFRRLQTGRIGHYALMMFGSLSILIFFGLLVR